MQPSEIFARLHGLPSWIPAALLAIIATAAAAESVHLGLGNASRPGPGFFPFLLSALLAVVASMIAFQAGRRKEPGNVTAHPSTSTVSLKIFLVLCLYCALLIPIGFIPATLIFFFWEARIIERVSFRSAALRGAIATVAAYALFALLGVQLPAGLWLQWQSGG